MTQSDASGHTLGPAAMALRGWERWARWLLVMCFGAGLAAYGVISWRWPVIHDTSVIHYVTFLRQQGWAPYRQIGDMNMPGAYLFDGWALSVFGVQDIGWRLYDFSLCAIAMVAMWVVGRRYDWLAGFVAGATFVMVHASEGPLSAGQRDQLIAVLLVVAFAFCLEGVRRGSAWMMGPFGLLCGLAASVKPTFVLVGPAVLCVVWMELRRRGVRFGRYALWALCGAGAATGIVVLFLVRYQALRAFLTALLEVLPHYATVGAASWSYLLGHTLPMPLFVYLGLAVMAALLDRNWGDWEARVLLVGVAAGLLNFYGQHKGFGQHRYTTVAFGVLWGTIQVFRSLQGRGQHPGYGRWAAGAALVFAVAVNLPRDVQWAMRSQKTDVFATTLEGDLRAIGVGRLQGQVQCLDVVDGCLKALFDLRIVQSTGSTGDLLLFLPSASPVIDAARAKFMGEMQWSAPEYFVLTNQAFVGERSFAKVNTWPDFAEFLSRDYQLVIQREFGPQGMSSHPGADPGEKAYRILQKHSSGAGSSGVSSFW